MVCFLWWLTYDRELERGMEARKLLETVSSVIQVL